MLVQTDVRFTRQLINDTFFHQISIRENSMSLREIILRKQELRLQQAAANGYTSGGDVEYPRAYLPLPPSEELSSALRPREHHSKRRREIATPHVSVSSFFTLPIDVLVLIISYVPLFVGVGPCWRRIEPSATRSYGSPAVRIGQPSPPTRTDLLPTGQPMSQLSALMLTSVRFHPRLLANRAKSEAKRGPISENVGVPLFEPESIFWHEVLSQVCWRRGARVGGVKRLVDSDTPNFTTVCRLLRGHPIEAVAATWALCAPVCVRTSEERDTAACAACLCAPKLFSLCGAQPVSRREGIAVGSALSPLAREIPSEAYVHMHEACVWNGIQLRAFQRSCLSTSTSRSLPSRTLYEKCLLDGGILFSSVTDGLQRKSDWMSSYGNIGQSRFLALISQLYSVFDLRQFATEFSCERNSGECPLLHETHAWPSCTLTVPMSSLKRLSLFPNAFIHLALVRSAISESLRETDNQATCASALEPSFPAGSKGNVAASGHFSIFNVCSDGHRGSLRDILTSKIEQRRLPEGRRNNAAQLRGLISVSFISLSTARLLTDPQFEKESTATLELTLIVPIAATVAYLQEEVLRRLVDQEAESDRRASHRLERLGLNRDGSRREDAFVVDEEDDSNESKAIGLVRTLINRLAEVSPCLPLMREANQEVVKDAQSDHVPFPLMSPLCETTSTRCCAVSQRLVFNCPTPLFAKVSFSFACELAKTTDLCAVQSLPSRRKLRGIRDILDEVISFTVRSLERQNQNARETVRVDCATLPDASQIRVHDTSKIRGYFIDSLLNPQRITCGPFQGVATRGLWRCVSDRVDQDNQTESGKCARIVSDFDSFGLSFEINDRASQTRKGNPAKPSAPCQYSTSLLSTALAYPFDCSASPLIRTSFVGENETALRRTGVCTVRTVYEELF